MPVPVLVSMAQAPVLGAETQQYRTERIPRGPGSGGVRLRRGVGPWREPGRARQDDRVEQPVAQRLRRRSVRAEREVPGRHRAPRPRPRRALPGTRRGKHPRTARRGRLTKPGPPRGCTAGPGQPGGTAPRGLPRCRDPLGEGVTERRRRHLTPPHVRTHQGDEQPIEQRPITAGPEDRLRPAFQNDDHVPADVSRSRVYGSGSTCVSAGHGRLDLGGTVPQLHPPGRFPSASAEILARTDRAAMIIAFRSRSVARNRPRLLSLEGEADQSHEELNIRGNAEVQRHPRRAGYELHGRCRPEVVLETSYGSGREVKVDVVVGVEVGDLAMGGPQGPADTAARLRLGEVGPGRQLRAGTRGQCHAVIMTSSLPGHQDVRDT